VNTVPKLSERVADLERKVSELTHKLNKVITDIEKLQAQKPSEEYGYEDDEDA
jgi:hypothetical protein